MTNTTSDKFYNEPSIPVSEHWNILKPEGRFNDWGKRNWIAVSEEKQLMVAEKLAKLGSMSKRATELAKAAFLTDSTGLEFVFVSSAQFPEPINLPESGLIIVPCFIPLDFNNLIVDARQSAMSKRGQFIYDGWILINDWNSSGIENVVKSLDEIINLFSVMGKYSVYWEPKYKITEAALHYSINPSDFKYLTTIIDKFEGLSKSDRIAIGRSCAWISDATRSESIVQKFLLLFVAMESLITYIESDEISSESPLISIASGKLPRKERVSRREECIKAMLAKYSGNYSEAIRHSYFECVVGSKKMVETHLNRVFNGDQISKILFESRAKQKTTWQMRNDIAHGSLDLSDDKQLDVYKILTPKLEDVVKRYIKAVLSIATKVTHFPYEVSPNFVFAASQGLGNEKSEYMGPTDMAEYYSNVEALSNSFVRFQF